MAFISPADEEFHFLRAFLDMYEAQVTIPSVAENDSKKLQEITVSGFTAQISAPAKNSAVTLSPRPPKKLGATPSISIIAARTTDGENPAIPQNTAAPAIIISDFSFLLVLILSARKVTIPAIMDICIPLTASM